jgi:hypothetical protein
MGHTIHIPLPEIDNILVFWKTRLVEQTSGLINQMKLGNKKWVTTYLRLKTLNSLKKTLRDYRFQSIYLTKEQAEKCIKMGNELASNY